MGQSFQLFNVPLRSRLVEQRSFSENLDPLGFTSWRQSLRNGYDHKDRRENPWQKPTKAVLLSKKDGSVHDEREVKIADHIAKDRDWGGASCASCASSKHFWAKRKRVFL